MRAVRERGDPVADQPQAVEVVGDHEHGQPQCLLERPDEAVELPGRDGIEAGGGLVEEDDVGIERQRAGERHALGHAAGKLGGQLVAVARIEPDHGELGGRHLAHHARRHVEIFAHRKFDVLEHGERGKQRALLVEHAPAPLQRLKVVGAGGVAVGSRESRHAPQPWGSGRAWRAAAPTCRRPRPRRGRGFRRAPLAATGRR